MELLIVSAIVIGPFALLGVLLSFHFLYSEKRMAARIGERFGLTGNGTNLSKPGWKLSFHNRPSGRSTEYTMGYEVHLQGLPANFHLSQRGEGSAYLSQHGMPSARSGDEDFDGLFHHQGKTALKPGQRGLLVELWQLLPDFGIDRNHVSGQLVYEQSPQGLAKLSRVVERLQSLQKDFPEAETYARTRPVGFVRRQKLGQEASICWAGATMAAAPALGYAAYAGVAGFSVLNFATLGCLLLLATGLGFVNCASRVSAGSYSAISALDWTRKLALTSGLVVLPQLLILSPNPIGGGVVALMLLGFIQLGLGQLKQKWEGVLDR